MRDGPKLLSKPPHGQRPRYFSLPAPSLVLRTSLFVMPRGCCVPAPRPGVAYPPAPPATPDRGRASQ